ncbi:Predicted protein [Mesomycoplasma hyopneumoniae 168]|uniref:Uncharacterized protein n=2 Tax=Mesomycoplasma hyopneumoniae (strain 168) TaxID=907287 RepID=E4QTV3_MESH1|nr:Predicted protein [Mesomycoplasma hyopneumoniae 168]AGM22422.1 hypothetical protein MHP168L_655 [Mesomycoplasma hyopneumoniae 168-L]
MRSKGEIIDLRLILTNLTIEFLIKISHFLSQFRRDMRIIRLFLPKLRWIILFLLIFAVVIKTILKSKFLLMISLKN